jgi:translation initiation factor 2 subunit 2
MALSTENEYLELLKRAYKNLPKASKSGERELFIKPNIMNLAKNTVITNFSSIASILNRDIEHIARFFFKETGKPGTIEDERLVIHGKIGSEEIRKLLELYIKEFVKCPICGSPDTKIIREKRFRFILCEACGAKSPVRKI